jgi:putative aminopeptidase FrvX
MKFTDLKKTLREMTNIPAPSGYETRMAAYMNSALEPYAREVWTDRAGNVIARFKGSAENAKRVMVFAHMDQLGLITKRIEDDGFIRMERLGGVPERILPCLELHVLTEDGGIVKGVCGMKSHHVTAADEKYIAQPVGKLYLDIGADSASAASSMGVEIGNPIVYKPSFMELVNGRVTATSIDNRGGCAVLASLAPELEKNPPPCDTYIVGSVTEEFNLRGAIVAARAIKPDIAICLDIMLAADTPDTRGLADVKLGGGPALSMYNFHGRGTLNGLIPHPSVARLAKSAARKAGLPLQLSAGIGSLTDASYVQLTETGVACVDLGFPCRYTHSPVETCAMSDLEQLGSLVRLMLADIGPDFSLDRI